MFTQVHWLGKEFHATVVTKKLAKITILLLQCGKITSLNSLHVSAYFVNEDTS